MQSLHYPRETVELIRLTVTANGQVTTDYEVSVVPRGQRPGDWAAPDTAGSAQGYMLGSLAKGVYSLWTRINSNPEHVVRDPLTFYVD